jgi:hypothetical protein
MTHIRSVSGKFAKWAIQRTRDLITLLGVAIRPQWPPIRRKNHETPRLATPVAGGHIRQKEKRHETA